MPKYPKSIENLIAELGRLPGVGPKTAERYAFALLKRDRAEREALAAAILAPGSQLASCSVCRNFAESDPCPICADARRDRETLCLVATEQDLLAVEHTGEYRGLYHVLGGTLSAADGVTPDDLTVRELLERLRREAIREIIFAFDQTVEGETTTMYLIRLLGRSKSRLTRLARGMPLGSEVNYADELTLSGALRERREVPNPFAVADDGAPF